MTSIKHKWPLQGSFGLLQLLQPTKETFVGYWVISCGTGEPEKQLGNRKTSLGYLNTLQGVQGFFHCPKGFKLGLGQGQKVCLDTDTYLTLRGSSRETKTCWHQWLYTVGINDNLINKWFTSIEAALNYCLHSFTFLIEESKLLKSLRV